MRVPLKGVLLDKYCAICRNTKRHYSPRKNNNNSGYTTLRWYCLTCDRRPKTSSGED